MKKKCKTQPYFRLVHEVVLKTYGRVADGKLFCRERLCWHPRGSRRYRGVLPTATTNRLELNIHQTAAGRLRWAASDPPPWNYPEAASPAGRQPTYGGTTHCLHTSPWPGTATKPQPTQGESRASSSDHLHLWAARISLYLECSIQNFYSNLELFDLLYLLTLLQLLSS